MVRTITVNELAKVKGVSRQAVHAAIKTGKLETIMVEVPSVRVVVKSANAWKPNVNMKRAGRKPANGHATRRFCDERAGGCGASLSSTDVSNGACTQCGMEIK